MVTYIINNQSTQFISYQIISEDIVNQCRRIFSNTAIGLSISGYILRLYKASMNSFVFLCLSWFNRSVFKSPHK